MRVLTSSVLTGFTDAEFGCDCAKVDASIKTKLTGSVCLSQPLKDKVQLGSFHCVCSVKQTDQAGAEAFGLGPGQSAGPSSMGQPLASASTAIGEWCIKAEKLDDTVAEMVGEMIVIPEVDKQGKITYRTKACIDRCRDRPYECEGCPPPSFEKAYHDALVSRRPVRSWLTNPPALVDAETACEDMVYEGVRASIIDHKGTGSVWCDPVREQSARQAHRGGLHSASHKQSNGSYLFSFASNPQQRLTFAAASAKVEAELKRIASVLSIYSILKKIPDALSKDEKCHFDLLSEFIQDKLVDNGDECSLPRVSQAVAENLAKLSFERIAKDENVEDHPKREYLSTKDDVSREDLAKSHLAHLAKEDEIVSVRGKLRSQLEEDRGVVLSPDYLKGEGVLSRDYVQDVDCEKFIRAETQAALKKKLDDSKARRAGEALKTEASKLKVFNPDYSCAIVSSIECVLNVDPDLWKSETGASTDLEKLVVSEHLLKDATKFREVIGGPFRQIDRTHQLWFAPRLFVQAMIDKLPTLKASTEVTFSVDGVESTQSIISLIPFKAASLAELIESNHLIFVTLPKLLILHAGGNQKLTYPHGEGRLVLEISSGESAIPKKVTYRKYQLKSAIRSTYDSHSECDVQDGSRHGGIVDVFYYEGSADEGSADHKV